MKIVIVTVLFLVYFFLFPRHSSREAVAVPAAVIPLETEQTIKGTEPSAGFRSGRFAGFMTGDYKLTGLYDAPGAAVGSDWIALYGPDGLEILDSAGNLNARIRPGAPGLARSNQLFMYDYDSGALSAIHDGQLHWTHEYIAELTALDFQNGRTLVGLTDGRAQIIDADGTVLYTYTSQDSRVSCVYGAALSDDGRRAALITGLDPQRFILLEEYSGTFRLADHHETGFEFRHGVPVDFIRRDGSVLYEGDRQLVLTGPESGVQRTVGFPGRLAWWNGDWQPDLLLLAGTDRRRYFLSALSRWDLPVFEVSLPSSVLSVSGQGPHILMNDGEQLSVLEMQLW